MKKHLVSFGLSSLAGLVVGAIVAIVFLKNRLETAMKAQREIEHQLDDLRSSMEAANDEMLIVRAELDLRHEHLRRLLEEEGGSEWRSLN